MHENALTLLSLKGRGIYAEQTYVSVADRRQDRRDID